MRMLGHSVSFQRLSVLIDKYAVSYAASASVLRICRSRTPAGAGRDLIIAVADKLTPHPERPAGCARMVYFLADDVEALKDERANNGW